MRLKQDKVLSLIGLATKAGQTASGEFMTEREVKTGRAALVIVAGDSSDNTKKKFRDMCEFYKSGTADIKHINYWLTDNCFGDYYTRKGLDYKQREMIKFCFLAAQGGCEPQLVSHIEANIRLGNDRAFLIKVISRGIPFLGYPRSLNALRCINEVIK